jgi:hypothetical protein
MKSFKQLKTEEWFDYDLKITIKPCFKCNHKCWFCSEYDNNTAVWTKDHCDLVIEKLTTIPKDRKRIFIYFYGGEPTLSQYWEYLHERIIDILNDRVLYIQTQTNLSLTKNRLDGFLKNITEIKQDHHTIDICSSYHIDKQSVNEFIEKMDVCNEYDCLGLCFFSTEIPKHDQCINEFNRLLRAYPNKIKLRFTETHNLTNKNIPGYDHLLTDQYLIGNDNGKSLEYRYWLRRFPEWKTYFETGWNFDVDGKIYNFSDVSGNNIHMKFKYMKCDCGVKNIVIDHTLNVFHCNDDYYSNINKTPLSQLDVEAYISRPVRCLNNACYDGLDFHKYV